MQDYIEKTKGMEDDFKMLAKKDKITARVIEKRMRELVTFHEQTMQLKKALIIKGCEMSMPVLIFCVVHF